MLNAMKKFLHTERFIVVSFYTKNVIVELVLLYSAIQYTERFFLTICSPIPYARERR